MKSRRKAANRNAVIAMIAQLTKILGAFLVQTVFVKTLGATYLGANGLFKNIINFISFAELGVGLAFSFSLYEPLAKKDFKTISAIMAIFRKAYNAIGTVILVVGLLLAWFVPYLTSNNQGLPHLRLYFILYLLSTVVSYYFTYNRSLLIADQLGYIDSVNQLIYSCVTYVGQVISLVLGSYFGYLLAQILGNLLSNIAITRKANLRYPELDIKTKHRPAKEITDRLKKNVIGTISSKLGSIVVNGTDNILISKFVGLAAVGFYSNYSLVISGITSMLNQVLNAVVASFGNLGATEKDDPDKQVRIFNQYVYYNAMAAFFIGLVLLPIFQPFITLWVGQKYHLSMLTVNLIVINFVLTIFRPALNMINAYGLFWGYRYKSIVEAAVNFGFSIFLVSQTSLGISAVLLGTIIGNIVVNSWWDPLILFGGAYHRGITRFYLKFWAYLAVFGAFLAAENWVLATWKLTPVGFVEFIIYSIAWCFVVGLALLVAFAVTDGERDLFRRVMRRRMSK